MGCRTAFRGDQTHPLYRLLCIGNQQVLVELPRSTVTASLFLSLVPLCSMVKVAQRLFTNVLAPTPHVFQHLGRIPPDTETGRGSPKKP